MPLASPRADVSAGQRLRVVAAGISALVLTVGFARFAYTPFLPVMRAEADLSVLAGGWLATINYAGYLSGALLASVIADIRWKFVLYRIGLVAGLLSTVAMGLTDSVWLWGILRYIAGLSSMTGLLLASGLALNWLMVNGFAPQLGLHFAGIGLGVAASGIAALIMAGHFPWDQQWLALGPPGAVLLVIAWIWMPAPDGAAGQRMAAQTLRFSRTWMSLVAASYFCGGFGYVVSATFIVAILVDFPALAGMGNLVWVLVGLAAIPSSFLWDMAARRVGPIRALMAAYALQTVSIILPAVTSTMAPNLLAAFLWGATFVGIVSLTLTLVGRQFPANPAKAMARLTLSYGVAQIVAPALAGSLAAVSGTYRETLIVAAVVMVAGIGCLIAVERQEARGG